MRGVGQGMKEFKKATADDDDDDEVIVDDTRIQKKSRMERSNFRPLH